MSDADLVEAATTLVREWLEASGLEWDLGAREREFVVALEQRDALGARQLGAVDAEVLPQVAQPGSREERVAQGVRGDVAVRVTFDATLPRPCQTCEGQLPLVVGERVDVDTDPGARQRHRHRRLRPTGR